MCVCGDRARAAPCLSVRGSSQDFAYCQRAKPGGPSVSKLISRASSSRPLTVQSVASYAGTSGSRAGSRLCGTQASRHL